MDKRNLISELMNNRYSSRDFEPDFEIPEKDIQTICEAIRMSPASYGLLNYRILVLPKSDFRETLNEIYFNQKNFKNSSLIIIFIADKGSSLENKTILQTANLLFPKEEQKEQKDRFILNFQQTFNLHYWNEPNLATAYSCSQTYIALGVATLTAAFLNIDTCIIGGFDEKKLDDILLEKGIINEKETVAISMAFGRDNTNYEKKKIRKPVNEFIKIIK